jgi:hypothetical protein
MNLEFYTVVDQFYIIPTIKFTYKRRLFGFYSVELVWMNWGLSLQW